jgi:hypothetical protein
MGASLAAKVAELTPKDIQEAASELAARASVNEPLHVQGTAASCLKSITSSCKVLGHTTQAAKDARRKMYALSDRFGPHSIFFTVTPDDHCTFKVRMYANQGQKTEVPQVNCSEEECILDFNLRTETRTKYPGACSLFYQAAIQAVYELLGWDPINNRSKGYGIFGPLKAVTRTDEEQARGTLHGHFLGWLYNFAEVSDLLFSNDDEIRESARESLRKFVDNHFSSDYQYNGNLEIIHEECGNSGTISELFEEATPQHLRDCRDKDLSIELEGKILQCKHCSQQAKNKKVQDQGVSTPQLCDMVLKAYKNLSTNIVSDSDSDEVNNDAAVEATPIPFPPTKYRRDIMTYRSLIDKLDPDSSDFYFNKRVRCHIAIARMNEHSFRHSGSCFKYCCSCRMRMPRLARNTSEFKIDENLEKQTTWRYLHKSQEEVFPYAVESKRLLGSQFLNTHNSIISECLACNNNVQIGSPRCLFYVVHYSSKTTQKDDRGVDFERIGNQIIRRIERERERLSQVSFDNGLFAVV